MCGSLRACAPQTTTASSTHPRRWIRDAAERHFHSGLDPETVVEVDGVAVTSPARTAIDCAAGKSFAQALAVLDSALRIGVTKEELWDEFHRRRLRGGAVVVSALRYADGRSANAGESWGRAEIITSGLPLPDLQTRFDLRDGSVAYVDDCWGERLAAEFVGLRIA